MSLDRDAYRPACVASRASYELPLVKWRELQEEVNERRGWLFFAVIVHLVGRLTILYAAYEKGDAT